jgi:hypothetical protein
MIVTFTCQRSTTIRRGGHTVIIWCRSLVPAKARYKPAVPDIRLELYPAIIGWCGRSARSGHARLVPDASQIARRRDVRPGRIVP